MQSWFVPPIVVPIAIAIVIAVYGFYRAYWIGAPF